MMKKTKCKECNGTGYIYPRPMLAGHEGYITCPVCDGSKLEKEGQDLK